MDPVGADLCRSLRSAARARSRHLSVELTIAYFISPHGFGHASRSCAVMEATWERVPDARFELFTTVPSWFFSQSLERSVGYSAVTTDLGLVQKSSLEEDLDQTIHLLSKWLPFQVSRLDELAEAVDEVGCDLVISDVSPLGLAVARHMNKPSVLIENFTWDWIYGAYVDTEPAMARVADLMAEAFATVGHHIQIEPVCRPVNRALTVPPVSRRARSDRDTVRRRLRVPLDASLVMVTMGGVEWDYQGIEERLASLPDERWLTIPGSSPKERRIGQTILLPHQSDYYHPDLIHASDVVIGKLGYSTIAEVYDAGVPFGYVPRPTFPESPPIETWVQRHLPCRRIDAESFVSWGWLEAIDPLLEMAHGERHPPGGAGVIADRILEIAGRE